MAHIPAVNNRQLDSIDYDLDGGLLLGASSLTNRYWTGSIWYYEDPAVAPDPESCTAGVETETGVSVVKSLENNRLVTGSDSGAVMLWTIDKESRTISCQVQPQEHDDFVTSVSVNSDKTRLVSASQDSTIKVWDLKEFASLASYQGHFNTVFCAACHPADPSVFASCSKDKRLLLWDLRETKSKPASFMETSALPSCPTSVAWHPEKEHLLAVGTETGHVVLQDRRWSVGTPVVVAAHTRSVQQMAFAPHRSSWLAAASEDCTATVIDFSTDTAKVIFRDGSHKDFVRSVAWNPKSHRLSTCGWDFQVVHHGVHQPETLSSPLATMALNGESVATGATDSQSAETMDTAPPPPTWVRENKGSPAKPANTKSCNGPMDAEPTAATEVAS